VRINSKDVELLYGTERIETEHEGSCAGETSEGDCGASRYSGTKVSVKSAVDHLETHGLGAQTTPMEPEVDKEGEPYCYEHEPIAKAEEVMREMKVDAVSVVSEEKKLIGK
jgi:hypothetical protein